MASRSETVPSLTRAHASFVLAGSAGSYPARWTVPNISRSARSVPWSCARVPQRARQDGDAVRDIEGSVPGGADGQRGDLVPRARLSQRAQQAGHAVRHVEGGAGGQRGSRLAAGDGPVARVFLADPLAVLRSRSWPAASPGYRPVSLGSRAGRWLPTSR